MRVPSSRSISLAAAFAGALFTAAPVLGAEAAGKAAPAPAAGPLALVINYPYQIYATGTTKIHVTLFRADFTPARGAAVKVDGKEVGAADANGVLVFDFAPGSGENHVLTASLKDGADAYGVTKNFKCHARTGSFESEQVYVYSDRGVYNPGQRVKVRLLAWRLKGDYAPIEGAKVELHLEDARHGVVTGRKVTTNAFGAAATEISLPENLAEGSYRLVVLYEKAREESAIRVERFTAPVIRIQHGLKRYLTATQDSLALKATLSYAAGGEIKSSTLALCVLDPSGAELFRRGLKEEKPGVYDAKVEKKELDGFRARLPKEQEFKIRLEAKDSHGRGDKVDFDVVYTDRPYRAVLEADKDSYVEGETVQFLAKVEDLDGKPAAGIPLTLEVEAFKAKAEGKTDEKGVATLTFPMGKQGAHAVLKSPIMDSPLAERAVPFEAKKPMVSKVKEPPRGVGSQAEIAVTFDPDTVPIEKVIHVDFTDISGGLVVSTTIPVEKKDGVYAAAGKVSSPAWGTMLCNLYVAAVPKSVIEKDEKRSPANVGFVTEGQHVTFHPDQRLKITMENLKPRARPGEKVSFDVKIEGMKGEACVGAAVVDASVISLKDPFLKTPEEHFYNPQRKVISTSGAGVLTWPVVDRNWGNPWRDIAYSDWGFKGPGGWTAGEGGGSGGGGGGIFGGGGGGVLSSKVATGTNPSAPPAEGAAPPPPGDPAPSPTKSGSGKKNGQANFGGMAPSADSKGELADANGAEEENLGMESGRANKGGPASARRITIRTRFPETCLWEPLLVTKDGRLTLTAFLPDEITKQQIALVATDKAGGIGFLRQEIEVRQELFVRSGLPAAMTLGDSIRVGALVRNSSENAIEAKVTLASGDFEVVSAKELTLAVPAAETAGAEWEIRAVRCGANAFTVSAAGTSFADSETKTIFVRPAGEPRVTAVKGAADARAAWTAKYDASDKAAYRVAFLNVSLPNVIPALQGVEAMARYPHGCVEQVSSSALTNVAVLEYGRKIGWPAERIAEIEDRLAFAAGRLSSTQESDGGWGWFRFAEPPAAEGGAAAEPARAPEAGPRVYLTAYALKTLVEIRTQDVPVADLPILAAMDFLVKARAADGGWTAKDAFFWEAAHEESDGALTAEIFSTLAAAAAVLPKDTAARHEKVLTELKDRMVKYLEKGPAEPLGVAHAVSGLLAFEKAHPDPKIKAALEKSVDRLIALKREGHWEPHWHHAYGGMVELNARILDLLHRFDKDRYDGQVRETAAWLHATREAWGGWHNTAGTAAAVRALLAAGAFEKEEKPSTLVVTVNGKEVRKVRIDPADPWLSAAELRHVEITSRLSNGANLIEVAYDGNLKASVLFEGKEWGVVEELASAPAPAIKVERKSAAKAAVGEPVPVTVAVASEKTVPYVMIEERIPSNAEADARSLEELKKKGAVADYRVEGGSIFFYLEKVSGRTELAYTLTATRPGAARPAGTVATAMYDPSLTGWSQGDALTVE